MSGATKKNLTAKVTDSIKRHCTRRTKTLTHCFRDESLFVAAILPLSQAGLAAPSAAQPNEAASCDSDRADIDYPG